MEIAQVNPNTKLVDYTVRGIFASSGLPITSIPEINLEEARSFIDMFGNGLHCYQTFDDDKERRDSRLRSKDWYGTFDDYKNRLIEKNEGGAAVALCINQNDGDKRGKEHIVKIRALFLDTDGAPLQPILDAGLSPHMVIESSPGKYHCYFLVDDCPINQFEPVMEALAHRFNCDLNVAKLCTVMRIPGFLHQKGKPFQSRIIEYNPEIPPYSINQLISTFNLVIAEPKKLDESDVRVTSREILICLGNNEDGDKDLFIRFQHGKLCYDHTDRDWYTWTGNHWKLDEVGEVVESTICLVDAYYGEADNQASLRIEASRNNQQKEEVQHKINEEKLIKRASILQSRKRKENVIYLSAQGVDSLGISGKEWDRVPWLLPVSNGVIDLHDGKFRPGKQSDYIKTVAPAEWKGIDTPAPEWENFLNEIIVTENFKPDPETVDYLHRLLGYSITGLTVEHVFPILWGDRGRNGKGTLLQTLSYILGPLAGKVSSETLLQSAQANPAGAASPHLMAFRGKRICFASETDQNPRLNVSLIKELSGGDIITARNLYAKHKVEFQATHTLFLMTNNRPVISAKTIDPIWDRIILIPFHLKYVDEGSVREEFERPKDIYLPDKLRAEAAGILAWLVRGCLAWQKEGLKTSGMVTKATAAYRKDEDFIGQFIEDKCETGQGVAFRVKPGQIYKSFRNWCDEQKIKSVPSQTAFGKDFKTRYETEGIGRNKFYLGIRLAEPEQSED